jgi:transposase
VPNPKPPYPPEFRAEAIRLARQPGQSIRRVATDLGISNESLRRWVIQAEIDRGESPGLTSDERAELTRLRRENRTLRIEREILKKAAVSSTGRRNSSFECSGRGREAERLAGPAVQLQRDGVKALLAVH